MWTGELLTWGLEIIVKDIQPKQGIGGGGIYLIFWSCKNTYFLEGFDFIIGFFHTVSDFFFPVISRKIVIYFSAQFFCWRSNTHWSAENVNPPPSTHSSCQLMRVRNDGNVSQPSSTKHRESGAVLPIVITTFQWHFVHHEILKILWLWLKCFFVVPKRMMKKWSVGSSMWIANCKYLQGGNRPLK